jgi:putative glycosyltransferase (TIGR04372 family)
MYVGGEVFSYFLWVTINILFSAANLFSNVKLVLLNSDGVGHITYNTDVFLRGLIEDIKVSKNTNYIGICKDPCNQEILNILKRKFYIKLLNNPATLLSRRRTTKYFINLHNINTHIPYYGKKKLDLIYDFNKDELAKGRELLLSMGLKNDDWHICFHSRDSVYLSRHLPLFDGSYHSFRDCSINSYLKAAEYIVKIGGSAIRMGYHVLERVPEKYSGSKIIDYASNNRSDFGDVYLPAKAKFFLGNTSGLFLVSSMFSVPVAIANYIPLDLLNCFKAGDIFIPKKIWSVDKKRMLTFREILDLGIGSYMRSELYKRRNLEIIDNSDDEIASLAVEMNELIDGVLRYSDEDDELQGRFRSLFKPCHESYGTPVRIGRCFLRDNVELLG